jgi:tetratricopeptide (TPR) repeat protein
MSNELGNSASTGFDYIFNHKAGEGTVAKEGSDVAAALTDKIRAIDVLKTPGLDDPEVKARFETYLSLPAVPDERIKDYFAKVALVSDTLRQGDTFGAWKILYAMSEYRDIDAGISRELANRVESIWNTTRATSGLEQANDKLRDNIETYDHNADLIAQDLHEQAQEDQGKAKSGSNSSSSSSTAGSTNSPLLMPNADPVAAEAAMMPTMTQGLQGKMELTSEYLKLLEARAKIKLNEIRENKMSDEGKEAFAEYVSTLFKTHRYYHMIIAADFYRVLFNEADYPPDMLGSNGGMTGASSPQSAAGGGASQGGQSANSAMNSAAVRGYRHHLPAGMDSQLVSATGLLSPLGQPETIEPVSMADQVTQALETNNQVNEAIEVFKYKAAKGEIAAAADQLQEAFLGNEYHPGLLALSRDDKEKVGDYLDKLSVLKNQLESRDFEQVDAEVGEIKKIASDFDATKPLALVNAVKLEARLRLGRAKLFTEGGRLDLAMQDFQTAAEEWPGNPDLQTSATGFFNHEDVQNQSTDDFDRLVKDQNYREIFDKQVAFAPAVKGDAAREQQLKDALVKVQKAEMASEKANLLVMNGDVDGAWETIEAAVQEWPDDMKLNKLLADLSGRSADFVSAVNKARDAEAKKEYGYSLSWFVNAENLYPASTIANDGIQRLSKQILSPAAPGGTAAATE